MMPFDAYRCYLSLKNHFTKDHYDYIKYRGKTRATHQAFYKRKDRFWFEKFARKKNDKEWRGTICRLEEEGAVTFLCL